MILALTDRAVIIAREQHFAKKPYYLKRIPISAVTQIYQKADRAITIWVLAGAIFLGGLIFAIGMAWNVNRELPGTKVNGWPFIFMALGIALPFLLKGRQTLTIQSGDQLDKWKPGIFDNSAEARQLQENFLSACLQRGIHVPKLKN